MQVRATFKILSFSRKGSEVSLSVSRKGYFMISDSIRVNGRVFQIKNVSSDSSLIVIDCDNSFPIFAFDIIEHIGVHPGTRTNSQEIYTDLEKKVGFIGNPKIAEVFNSVHDLLQYKNNKYGNSATEPIGVFSKATADTGLLQRLDDKIARIKNSPDLRKNDVADVIGYLVLLCVTKGWDNFDEFKD